MQPRKGRNLQTDWMINMNNVESAPCWCTLAYWRQYCPEHNNH